MANITTNFNLIKPNGTDAPDIANINANMDIIDNQLKVAQDQIDAAAGHLQTEIDGLQGQLAPLIYNGVAHNAIYRGKNLGASVTASQYTAISDGTFEDLYIGDYWTIGGVNYRIAAFDYYWNCGDSATPPHHAVIVPDKSLYNAVMNDTVTTTGGYIGSQMYTTNLEQAKTTIKAAFSGHVVNHRIYLVNAVTSGHTSGEAWVDSEVDLMNEQMVYGTGIFFNVSPGIVTPANYIVEINQLPLFAMNPAMLNTRETYWLRDVTASSRFADVYQGYASSNSVINSFGVRPAFCIS